MGEMKKRKGLARAEALGWQEALTEPQAEMKNEGLAGAEALVKVATGNKNLEPEE